LIVVGFLTANCELRADVGVIPPPANLTIDFDRDVRPIFEQSCFRCHGPERPKSGFRLDNRTAALKGGRNNPDDIVPGHSDRSRLIRYVAGVVDGMEMPPLDKGDPLTLEQVGMLRAWIDQGASWGVGEVLPEDSVSVTPVFSWWSVHGDQAKFQELEGVKAGFGGGVENFQIEQQTKPDQKVFAEGHFLVPENDFRLKLVWTKTEVGFIDTGFEQWRKYYDDAGGYYQSLPQPQFSLNKDLYLDSGRAWINFGLTLPDRPQIVLGYEFQYQDGNKSMLEWGNVNGKNIYPAFMEIHENVQIVKLDIAHELYGWRVEDNARVEFYSNDTKDQQVPVYTANPDADGIVKTHENSSHVQGANVLRLEKQLTDWWFCSGGCLYSHLDGDSSMNQSTVNAANAPVLGNIWTDQVTLRREMQVVSVASMFLPIDGLSFSTAAQAQFSRQEGFGDINLAFGVPGDPPLPAKVQSDLDETKTTETAALRYNKIPFTALFAEGRFEQDAIGQFEQETGGTADVFMRNTDFNNELAELRAGFNLSPWPWMALNAQYKNRVDDSHYNNKEGEPPLYNPLGYSAFIKARQIDSDEVETKLVLHPVSWLKATLTYQRTESDYHTTTDPVDFPPPVGNVSPGGQNLAGTCNANTYGVNVNFIPSHRIYFFGSFIYSDSRTVTGHNEAPGVVPYSGETYSVVASASYSLNPQTTLQTSYAFSRSDYGQNNSDGLPLGLVYTRQRLTVGLSRKLSKKLTTGLRYSFSDYHESSSGGLNDFVAHGVFVTVTTSWP
jgi:hypothetical protein